MSVAVFVGALTRVGGSSIDVPIEGLETRVTRRCVVVTRVTRGRVVVTRVTRGRVVGARVTRGCVVGAPVERRTHLKDGCRACEYGATTIERPTERETTR